MLTHHTGMHISVVEHVTVCEVIGHLGSELEGSWVVDAAVDALAGVLNHAVKVAWGCRGAGASSQSNI